MSSDLVSAMSSASSGLRAQTVRIRISAENLANASLDGRCAGADPYRRKAPIFKEMVDVKPVPIRLRYLACTRKRALFQPNMTPPTRCQ